MADEKRDSQVKTSEQLDEELDGFLETIKEKNKNFKYTDGFTSENIDEELELNPAFLTKAPTQAQIDASPALQALQALKYEEDNPDACALAYKEDGNYHFGKKSYRDAIKAYTEGLKQEHDDGDLKAILLTNRAAANFHLGNNRSAFNDAVAALKHKPDHMKAIIRASISCFDMEKYEDCVTWCEKGLKLKAKEQKLVEYKKKAIHQKKQKDRDERKNNMKQFSDLQERKKILDAFMDRSITLFTNDPEGQLDEQEYQAAAEHLLFRRSPQNGKVTLDENGDFYWPVHFLYPEYNQSDFLEAFHEDVRLEQQLDLIFAEHAEWDDHKLYTPKGVELFFEDTRRRTLIRVAPETTLRTVLADKRYRLNGECPAFMVMASKSEFYSKTFENQNYENF